jgi:hypothetical protein
MTRDFLATKDVADLWTKARDAAERRAARAAGRDPVILPPISPDTVREYVRRSTPAPPGAPPNRYQDNPMPMPAQLDPQRLIWVPAPGYTMDDVKAALRAWFLDRTRQPDVTRTGDLAHLTMADVARIWTEERRRRDGDDAPAITFNTVKAYVWFSEPAPPGKPPKRFQNNPVPPSVQLDKRRRVWIPGPGETLADVEQALRDWYNDPTRPGKGVGGGRKPAKTTRRRK